MIKNVFAEISSKINNSNMSTADKLSATMDITEATKELVKELLASSKQQNK